MKPLQVNRFVRVSPRDHHCGQRHVDPPARVGFGSRNPCARCSPGGGRDVRRLPRGLAEPAAQAAMLRRMRLHETDERLRDLQCRLWELMDATQVREMEST
jgi:hypothetical protein